MLTVAAAIALAQVLTPTSARTAARISEPHLDQVSQGPEHWLTYSGNDAGHRHSQLKQITAANVGGLRPVWTFQTGLTGHKFEATPLAIDGVLYITGALNHAWAIDGVTGRRLWEYRRRLPSIGALRACCGLVNRGFAWLGRRLFMATLDAHLVALNAETGIPVWDVPVADYRLGYTATVAPLIVRNRVIVGISGGEFAVRGFLDAYGPGDGRREWRFWTVPAPGEPGSETWPKGSDAWQRG